MALSTSSSSTPPAPQHPTPGVGLQGAPPTTTPNPPPEPVLFPDIDPVLLVRLYPAATDAGDMRAQAMAAGQAAMTQGATLVASQQEPVLGAGETPPEHHAPPAPRHQAADHRPDDKK
jgi:hypothetical protein